MVINRVGPLSVAKLAGMLYAILGLIFGAIISVLALAGSMAANADQPAAMFFGAGAVIVLPILYGCIGFLMMLLMAALYNLTARIVGGVEIDIS